MSQGPYRSRSALALLAVTSLVLTAFAASVSAGASTAAQDTPAPDGLPAFYSVPKPLQGKPGTLIKTRKVASPGLRGTMYRVMYLSEALDGKPVAVTGLVAVPHGTAPPHCVDASQLYVG